MVENKQNEMILVNEQIEQLQIQLADLTEKHVHLKTIVEQLQETLLHEIKQETNEQQDVQIVSSFNKDKEIAAFTEENRSFIQSIWKRKK